MNLIGNTIRKLREEQGLTQDQFAARCNLIGWDISRGTLAKIESKVRRITDIEVALLAQALNQPIESLFDSRPAQQHGHLDKLSTKVMVNQYDLLRTRKMHSLHVAEFKANLSSILAEVKTKGEEYIVEFGRNHEKVAVLIPYEKYQQQFQQGVKLGLFADTASVEFKPDFKMTDKQDQL